LFSVSAVEVLITKLNPWGSLGRESEGINVEC
jgi:hypothetical protein